MNSGSSAFMRSGSHSAGWSSTTASYQRSRGICISTAPPVWRTTSTVSTDWVPGSLSAASTLAFSGTFLLPRRPSSAVMISLAPQLPTRSAMELGAKPPKTTMWIAPMRAQASIAIAASGIIGR